MQTINPWQMNISPASPVHCSIKIRTCINQDGLGPHEIYFDKFLAMLDGIQRPGAIWIDHVPGCALRSVV
jgi:hypothetical protein